MSYKFKAKNTAVLLVDTLNDFIGSKGKVWPSIQEMSEKVNLVPNLKSIRQAADNKGIQVVFVPHVRYKEGNYANWKYLLSSHKEILDNHTFAAGTYGAEFHESLSPRNGDLVAKDHWTSSGFANTDLDFLLRIRGIDHVIVVGLFANTCVENTGRFAAEMGYHVTFVSDAVVARSQAAYDAAINVNYKYYGHQTFTTAELVEAFESAE